MTVTPLGSLKAHSDSVAGSYPYSGSAMVLGRRVHATGPSMSQLTSATTLTAQSAAFMSSRVNKNGEPSAQ